MEVTECFASLRTEMPSRCQGHRSLQRDLLAGVLGWPGLSFHLHLGCGPELSAVDIAAALRFTDGVAIIEAARAARVVVDHRGDASIAI